MPQQVRGVVAHKKGEPVSLETVIVPDPGPGEAVVKVQACGVCHTDLHYREGGINDEFPFVLGCGGVGDAAIAGARLAGASTIIAIDVDDRKLAWAKEFGATHTINSRSQDVVEGVKALTDGNGANVVVEAVGRPETYKQAFYARDLAGTVVL